jgi:hypothetical protein
MNTLSPLALIALLLACASTTAQACSATLASNGQTSTSIQAAFDASAMTDTITVNGLRGVCSENLLFPNTRLRTILQGINGASLQANYLSPAIDTRVKATAIFGMTIQGGSDGIVVQRNANAGIDRSTIQGAAGNGVVINEMASAFVLNSTIQNNGASGILASRNAAVNIGINNVSDKTAAPNTIQNNGASGVVVESNSIAYIVSNTISNNREHGVLVAKVSSAQLSGNLINANGVDGLSATGTSHVQLGGAVPATKLLDTPNQTTMNNVRYGVSSYRYSNVEGYLGEANQLMGEEWQFDGDADSDGVQMLGVKSTAAGRRRAR